MADAWSVVVDREPEWDDYSRAEAVASLIVDQFRCRNCGVEGALTEIPKATRHWKWGDGRKFEVTQWRCLACAAEETVRRDFLRQHEKTEPVAGSFHVTDGIRFAVTELDTTQGVAHGGPS